MSQMPHPHGMPQKIDLPNIKYIVAIASGKGGVGKSTVAANLALALHKQGHQVGLMDADIYGPSLPTMLGVSADDWPRTPYPVEKFGLKLMSMGLLIDPDQAAAMRGPMIHKYLTAFLTQFQWGALEFLIVDLPPGTGDAQMSLAQIVPVAGAVVVTTPQDVSLNVVRRGLSMFRTVRIPVLGIVENLSYFIADDGKRYEIFGKGAGAKIAAEWEVPLLASIPIDPEVAKQGDAGDPIVHTRPGSPVGQAYLKLATAVKTELERVAKEGQELPTLEM